MRINPTSFGRFFAAVGKTFADKSEAPLRQAMNSKYGDSILDGTAAATIYRGDRAIGIGAVTAGVATAAAGVAITTSDKSNYMAMSDEEVAEVFEDIFRP